MKKILKSAALLTALCILFNCSIICFASEKAYQKGDIIEFGSYPQSKVTDESIISKLNKYECKWTDVTGEIYSEKLDDYIDTVIYSYADSEHNGEKYRAVKYSDSVAENIENTSTEIQWFRYEPIEWVIIDPETGYILCNDIIDIQQFNKSEFKYDTRVGAARWDSSGIRTWLNNAFYNVAFNELEKDNIKSTTTNNLIELDEDQNEIIETVDNIILFSLEDVLEPRNGFDAFRDYDGYYYQASETLTRVPTEYTYAINFNKQMDCGWFLRRTSGNQGRPSKVYEAFFKTSSYMVYDPITGEELWLDTKTGIFCSIDHYDIVLASDFAGICPAMHIDLENFDKEAVVFGDIDSDGKITASDARLTLRASVGLDNLSEASIKAADIDKNGTVSASDARLILRASVGLEDTSKW